ncbi:hypothetical protein PIB30_029248 [Stylosanthes scabra]|uniref:Uncharacterized protein n=1 Tax=Stylosanthes scabra TaxID=79078 RepID=A0ABU6TAY0_9FABA|nr:hypothetical protein [Stylosanthes scabra]
MGFPRLYFKTGAWREFWVPRRDSGEPKVLNQESNPSGVNPKSNSISKKTRPSECIQSSSNNSSKEVSSKSKESTNSKKSKTTKRIEESGDPEMNHFRLTTKFKIETWLKVKKVPKVSNLGVNNPSSALTNKGIFQKVVPLTPNIPIQPGTNKGIPIDPRVQFQERLEEARAENVKRVKESVRPLPSIPVIDIEANDELDDMLKVISETKAGSEHIVSNSENKSVQQPPQSFQPPPQTEKEDSLIQQARNASMQKTIRKSTKDAYWNNELVVFTSCLVEKQFPNAYREKVQCIPKIFDNLFHSRENLSNLRLKAALVKENCETLATAETDLKEKDALYEKHLKDANIMLDGLSTEREILVKKLAEIQAQIQEIDNKTSKIKKPLDKIQGKKIKIQDKLSEIKENQKLNEEDLKNIQKEENEETQLFRSMCEEKIQLKETLKLFLKEIDG